VRRQWISLLLVGGRSACAEWVGASECRDEVVREWSEVEMVAVVLWVERVNSIESFFFVFVYCCDDVWDVVVAVVPCVVCVMLPTVSRMLVLRVVGCDRDESR